MYCCLQFCILATYKKGERKKKSFLVFEGEMDLSLICAFLLCSAYQAGASGKAGTAAKPVFDVKAAKTQATDLLLSDSVHA